MREARCLGKSSIGDRAAALLRKWTYVTLHCFLPYRKIVARQQLLRPNFVIADFHWLDSGRAEFSHYLRMRELRHGRRRRSRI